MGGFGIGIAAAKWLVRMRIVLAGEGVVRQVGPSFRATLPGRACTVEIDERARTGIFRVPAPEAPDAGSAIAPRWDAVPAGGHRLDTEGGFHAFMQGVDVAMAGRLPAVVVALADEYARACLQGDRALASIVADGNLELPGPGEDWLPGPALRALVEAARHSDDGLLSEAALDVAHAMGRGFEGSAPVGGRESGRRWAGAIVRWAADDDDFRATVDCTWVPSASRDTAVIALNQLGHGRDAIMRFALRYGQELREQDGRGALREAARWFALLDARSRLVGVGMPGHGDLGVIYATDFKPHGDEEGALRSWAGPRGLPWQAAAGYAR